MKKKLLSLAVVVICLAIIASGTIAYFSAEDTAHNVITSSGISVEIVEKTRDSYGTLVDFPEGGIHGVMPGSAVSKIVSVENCGGEKAWLRVRVNQSITGESGSALSLISGNGSPVMSFHVDEDKWILWEGWYYYRESVSPGEATELLFEEVCFTVNMDNEYQNCTAYIEIQAQAVQTANNGDTVLEAQGWPMEVTD